MKDYEEIVKKLIDKYVFLKNDDMSYAHLVLRDSLEEVSPRTGRRTRRGFYGHCWDIGDGKEMIPGVDDINILGDFANELKWLIESYLDGSLEKIDVVWFLNRFYKR